MNDYVPKHRFEILKENQIEIQEVYRDILLYKAKTEMQGKIDKASYT